MKTTDPLFIKLDKEFKDLFTDKFYFSELLNIIESLIQLIYMAKDTDYETLKDDALEAFTYFDSKYHIIQSLDDLIKLPSLFEPFDSAAFKMLIEKVIIPITVKNMMNLLDTEDEAK
jgi:hypothetical protein